jgi:hypothetical protein
MILCFRLKKYVKIISTFHSNFMADSVTHESPICTSSYHALTIHLIQHKGLVLTNTTARNSHSANIHLYRGPHEGLGPEGASVCRAV